MPSNLSQHRLKLLQLPRTRDYEEREAISLNGFSILSSYSGGCKWLANIPESVCSYTGLYPLCFEMSPEDCQHYVPIWRIIKIVTLKESRLLGKGRYIMLLTHQKKKLSCVIYHFVPLLHCSRWHLVNFISYCHKSVRVVTNWRKQQTAEQSFLVITQQRVFIQLWQVLLDTLSLLKTHFVIPA